MLVGLGLNFGYLFLYVRVVLDKIFNVFGEIVQVKAKRAKYAVRFSRLCFRIVRPLVLSKCATAGQKQAQAARCDQ